MTDATDHRYHVVVTGGGTGIGYAAAEAFRRAGDQVTITGRREQVLTEAATSLGATPVVFDAADPAAVTSALADLPDRVDVLVNNAGGNTDLTSTGGDDGDLAHLAARCRANLDANLISAVLVTTALSPRLADNARIITIGSIAAKKGAGSYGASKAAVEAWNADLSAELGSRGITANVVSPGLIVDTEFFHGRLSDDRARSLVAQTRTGRAGSPQDVAATIRFLAEAAAGHLTGQVLHVNGGAYLGS